VLSLIKVLTRRPTRCGAAAGKLPRLEGEEKGEIF